MEDNYIGEKIREIRKKNGLSQEEFAYKVNVAKQTVSCWELGTIKPNFKNIKVICEVFKVSADIFLQNSEVVCTTYENLIENNDKLNKDAESVCEIELTQNDEESLKKVKRNKSYYNRRIAIGIVISTLILIIGLIFIISTSIFTTNVGIVTTQSSHWHISETLNVAVYIFLILSFIFLISLIIKLKIQNKNKRQ